MSAESSPISRRCLVTLHTPDAKLQGRTLPLGDLLRIGRIDGDEIDLVIRDRLISSAHALVRRTEDGRYELLDHGSRNGSFVDGERVRRMLLSEGHIIRVGITLFELAAMAEPGPDRAMGDPRLALVGGSAAFLRMLVQVEQAAKQHTPLVLLGEPGTGKKRLAKYLHDQSGRSGPLVVMECGGAAPPLIEADLLGSSGPLAAAVPGEEAFLPIEGYFSLADGGTLVVDHVDELSPALQPHVLELLRSGSYQPLDGSPARHVDVRLVFTTCNDVETAVQSGSLDPDLAAAIGPERVELPSLRTRRSDIAKLARHFLDLDMQQGSHALEWSPGCLERLLLYDWPVNVRELRVVMGRMAALEEGVQTLRSAHLPREIRRQLRQRTEDALRNTVVTVHAVPSRDELSALLDKHAGNIGALAEHYAKDRRHVRRWLLRHDLQVPSSSEVLSISGTEARPTRDEPASTLPSTRRERPTLRERPRVDTPANALPSTRPEPGSGGRDPDRGGSGNKHGG